MCVISATYTHNKTMGGLFSSAETAPQKYWGKWEHSKKANSTYGDGGTATKFLTIHTTGHIRSHGTITQADGTTTSYDTGAIAVTGWKEVGVSVVMGGFLQGIAKSLEISALGDMHVTTDESAEVMCAGGRETVVSETYRKV